MASAEESLASESESQFSKEEVIEWLQNSLGEEKCPTDLDNEKLKILYALMEENKEMCRVANLVIDDMNRKADEYAAEAKRIALTLCEVGISVHSLPEMHQSILAAMCSASGLLNLKNPSVSNFLLGISDLSQELSKVQLERLDEQKLLQKLILKNKYMEEKLDRYKKELKVAKECIEQQENEAEKLPGTTKFFLAKQEGYKTSIDKFEARLNSLGITDDIHHDNLVVKAKEVDDFRKQVKVKQTELEAFHGLPPDIELARAAVKEKQDELDQLFKEKKSKEM